MLILTRKAEQGIVIDGQIVVRLLAIDGERVKLGVEAPRSVSVLREELIDEVADQNQSAVGVRGALHLARALGRLDRGNPDRGGTSAAISEAGATPA